jgi:hypothetical protein
MGSPHDNRIAHWDPEPLGIEVARLALRDVLPDYQSQRDWSYPGKVHGKNFLR